MHIEEITYDGYDGEKHTDKFYFNLNESDLIELNFSKKGGYLAWLERIINEHDNTKIVPMIRNIILTSYGKRSDDGIRFDKSTQISNDFYHTDAYNKLFVKLFTNTDELVKFCSGIIPKDLSDEVKKSIENGEVKLDDLDSNTQNEVAETLKNNVTNGGSDDGTLPA